MNGCLYHVKYQKVPHSNLLKFFKRFRQCHSLTRCSFVLLLNFAPQFCCVIKKKNKKTTNFGFCKKLGFWFFLMNWKNIH